LLIGHSSPNEFSNSRPSIFQVPKIILNIAVGEFANAIVSGQKVSVTKLLNSGYEFKFENLEDALRDLLKK